MGEKGWPSFAPESRLTVWTLTPWGHTIEPMQWVIVIGAALFAAASDIRTRRIPNLLTGPLFAAGLLWATWNHGLAGLGDAVIASVLLACPYVLLFAFAGGGAGDAKLMGAIGAWLGVMTGLMVLVSVLLAGVILAVGFALSKRRFKVVLVNLARAAQDTTGVIYSIIVRRKFKGTPSLMPRIQDLQTMPYGVAIFLGVCIAAGGVFAWHA